MALSSKGEELLEHGLKSVPHWVRGEDRSLEDMGAAAKVAESADDQGEDWASQARITTATGPVGAAPDWLAAHARDRGTDRQENETDPGLRDRLRNIDDAVTRSAILEAAQAIIDEEGISGDVAGVELPRDGAYSQVTDLMGSGTGGVFADEAGTSIGFEPDDGYPGIPFREVPEVIVHKLEISSANSAGNDGERTITGLVDNAALVTNASGVAESDAGADWEVRKYDTDDNRLDGFADAYFDRGDRFADFAFIVILPYGSDETTQAKVEAMINGKKGFTYPFHVERRLNP